MNKDVCSACDSLKATSSNFIQKGVTDAICANLKANQGFENKGHNNCTDMHYMNDCLLGGLLEKIDTYDVCDVKESIKDEDNLYPKEIEILHEISKDEFSMIYNAYIYGFSKGIKTTPEEKEEDESFYLEEWF